MVWIPYQILQPEQAKALIIMISALLILRCRLADRSNMTMKSSQILLAEALNEHCLERDRLSQFYT